MAIDDDLRGFEDLAAVLRKGPSDVNDEMPSPSLWADIESALAAEGGGASIHSLADRRRPGWGRSVALAVVAAAAVALVGVPIALALRGSEPSVSAELTALPGFESAAGRAELDDGLLAIDVEGLEPIEGEHYELWLLKFEGDELADLVSLGVLDDGRHTVPEGVDVEEFDTVDISIEADDGDPSHSGKSVLRGELNQA